MRARLLALAVMATACLVVPAAAGAATGPPPPPTAAGGQQVTQVAADLHTPTAFAYGDGTLFESDGGPDTKGAPRGGIFMISAGTATELKSRIVFSAGVAWHDGALYVSGAILTKAGPTWQLQRWSGFSGSAFASEKVLYTAPAGFGGFNGIAFGPDGRLYVGADVGLTDNNDHGPTTTSPYLYDVLSFTAAGKDLQVFATGMRQPWQMVFPHGSASPLVSNLGPDKGPARNPLDAVLRVTSGENYGFPSCTPTTAALCPSAPAAFAEFSPHSDIMGLAIIGKTLYLSSFAGIGARAKAGEVLAMPLSGGRAKPFLTGFVAPIVGLGSHAGTLYVGEVTGQAFSVRP